jgi:hypothetical protein
MNWNDVGGGMEEGVAVMMRWGWMTAPTLTLTPCYVLIFTMPRAQ